MTPGGSYGVGPRWVFNDSTNGCGIARLTKILEIPPYRVAVCDVAYDRTNPVEIGQRTRYLDLDRTELSVVAASTI